MSMNATSQLFSWIARNFQEEDEVGCCFTVVDRSQEAGFGCEDGNDSEPSLTASNSSIETELYSVDCNSSVASTVKESLSCQDDDDRSTRTIDTNRRVRFDRVHVREYAVTVGDHPFCNDGLALTLDWNYSDCVITLDIECSRERHSSYRLPPKLSYDERRERLLTGSAYTNNRVRNEEIGTFISRLRDSWARPSLLPLPLYEDLDEEEKDQRATNTSGRDSQAIGDQSMRSKMSAKASASKKLAQQESVFEWKRNSFHRSQSFNE